MATVSVAGGSPTAHADGCYTWERTLRKGVEDGEDVQKLRVRLGGYSGYGQILGVDDHFGPATGEAVREFKQTYGLTPDTIAGPAVFEVLYSLQDDDCTPAHFNHGQMHVGCSENDYDGGAVPERTAKFNALRILWKLEALRHAVGDAEIEIVSGFRDDDCNAGVGVPNSRHRYGDAADIVSDDVSLCDLAQEARDRGFDGIYGPGFPNHDDHVHLSGANESWSAPDCNVERQGSSVPAELAAEQ